MMEGMARSGIAILFVSSDLEEILGISDRVLVMHDGRLATLEQVVEHYASGIQNGPALDNRLRGPGGAPQRLPLTVADKAALVAFMRTLTDTVVAADAKFATPFRP